MYFSSQLGGVWVSLRSFMSAPGALRSVIVHEYREDASVKATGKWKATLVTVAAASSVVMATGAGASAINNHGTADIDQKSSIDTWQASVANSGFNSADSHVKGENENSQTADGTASDGNVYNSGDYTDTHNGNKGGPASNTNSGKNDGTSSASAGSGSASASNGSNNKVTQNNGGGVTSNVDATGATLSGGGSIDNSGNLSVDQHSSIETHQIALANSGFNSAKSGVSGSNESSQSASSGASGGNVHNDGDHTDTHAGNQGGSASNTNSGSNTGKSSATVSSGNASASNSSTNNVSQNNSGSVNTSTNAKGATLSGWSGNSGW